MPTPTSEADARILIDHSLRQAGWDPADKSQVRTEVPVYSSGPAGVSEGKPGPGKLLGYADYVLLDQNGRPLAVTEAKKDSIQPYTAKQQALAYAEAIGAPFIFLANGELIYFWDHKNGDARPVNAFYGRRDLERVLHMREHRKPLATIEVPEFYVRQGETREVRPYQQEAMRALDRALELGKRRFLIELPTGTGKTDLTVLAIKRLLQAGRAERVLFLVDREQLAKQTLEAVQDLLSNYSSYWLKPGVQRQEQQVTVALLQTMIGRYEEYSAGYFDLVVTDECHRSIYGAWQAALTHFDAIQIGLTATPADYIERDTFAFFQCKGKQPDFSFTIREAFKEGYLAPYRFAQGITELIAEGAEVDGEQYDPAQFERRWTNAESNRLMMEQFDALAWRDAKELAPGLKDLPGKGIVFAITKHHAARLAEILNALHPEYNGRYAEVITSDVPNADDLIRKFKKEKLPMVAVSVDMLTTGFDLRELLHVVLCRAIRSPILYQQIRGRGTRIAPHIGKLRFVIYDFFRNHQYFNDNDPGDLVSSGGGGARRPGPGPTPGNRELTELGLADEWLETVHYVEVGPEGERVDKKQYLSTWKDAIVERAASDPLVQKVRAGEPLSEEEESRLAEQLNQPASYFNEENLRRAYQNPGGTLIDFIKAALGLLKVKSRAEVLDENFHAWLAAHAFSPEQADYLVLLKDRGVAQGRLAVEDLLEPPLALTDAFGRGLRLFGEAQLAGIVEEMNDAVLQRRPA
jgi:type I restriction enzyme R subunit